MRIPVWSQGQANSEQPELLALAHSSRDQVCVCKASIHTRERTPRDRCGLSSTGKSQSEHRKAWCAETSGEGCAICYVCLLSTVPSLLQGHHLHFPNIGVTSWTPDLTDIYMEAACTNAGPGAGTLSTWPTELVSPGPQCYPVLKIGGFCIPVVKYSTPTTSGKKHLFWLILLEGSVCCHVASCIVSRSLWQ